MAYRGVNYGKLDTESSRLRLTTQAGASVLSLDYNTINNSTINKNDVVVETATDDLGNEDFMCEIRFYVEDQRDEKEEMDVEGEAEGE